ncbi:hypothetical protein ABGB17_04050 [Sphaerisporangium sp. B11E5]|uniref:hypothetical protein n=1 Tax=Sphaerisporangium sp. B11E5 TaxID=3153563 RepID=UPI00325C81AF
MRSVPMDAARAVADAVLYEGYLLYPYRASAAKNRLRWQFGVLVPPAYQETAEPSGSVTEVLLDGGANALLRVRLRFLHVRERRVERREEDGGFTPVAELRCGDTAHLSYDDATERETEAVLAVPHLIGAERTLVVRIPGDRAEEQLLGPSGEVAGRLVTAHRPLHAVLRVRAERPPGPYGLLRLRVRVENRTAWLPGRGAARFAALDPVRATTWQTDGVAAWIARGEGREEALRHSLVAAHLLIGATAGSFLSLADPPEWARAAARTCRNRHTWPVLVGDPGRRDVVLSSPIILDDHPGVAPESPGGSFDSTEMDEMLHLRALTLTEEERREAEATDPRAAELLKRAADLPPEMLERLHGAIRHLGPAAQEGRDPAAQEGRDPAAPARAGDPAAPEERVPWWDPAAEHVPGADHVTVCGTTIRKGSRVRLVPGRRRADAHDMFLAGRAARVEAVLLDVDGGRHLAVTLEDDPGADLRRAHGRYLYFAPDEVEPLEEPAREDTGEPENKGVEA